MNEYQKARIEAATKAINEYTQGRLPGNIITCENIAVTALTAADAVPTPRDLIEQAYKMEKAND